MEMHSRRSLYEIHGISSAPRRRSRWGTLTITGLLAILKRVWAAIEAELAARCAIEELAHMNDHMLRDLGISRSEVESRIRRPRVKIGTNIEPVLSNDAGQNYPALPTVYSPDLVAEGRPERQLGRLHLR
jgi:uncharacterized protein YjiS (DUF1127 family)